MNWFAFSFMSLFFLNIIFTLMIIKHTKTILELAYIEGGT